jgi:hypothetical protein
MTLQNLHGLGICVVMIAAVGCGRGNQTVSGKVTLDGAPLANARVAVISKDLGKDPLDRLPYIGQTDEQGAFALGAIDDPGGGVPAGSYLLAITTAHTSDTSENAVRPPERVPAPYPLGIDFEVPDGGKTDANFDLESK